MSFGRKSVASAYELVVQHLAKDRPLLSGLSAQFFPDQEGPRPRSLIEISGGPNSGKSLLLHELMALSIPPTHFGGRNCDVVFIDLKHKFDPLRFVEITVQRVLSDTDNPCPKAELDSVAQDSAKSITLLSCYTADELELAFDVVEDVLWKNGKIALLAVDGLDAYYWTDAHHKLIRQTTHYAKSTARLRQICDDHNICCAYTIDARYIEAKPKADTTSSVTSIANYRFELQLWPDTKRTLNDRLITIDVKGIRYANDAQQHL